MGLFTVKHQRITLDSEILSFPIPRVQFIIICRGRPSSPRGAAVSSITLTPIRYSEESSDSSVTNPFPIGGRLSNSEINKKEQDRIKKAQTLCQNTIKSAILHWIKSIISVEIDNYYHNPLFPYRIKVNININYENCVSILT